MNALKFEIYNGSGFGDPIYFYPEEVEFFKRVPANEFEMVEPNYNKPIPFDISKFSDQVSTRERWIFAFNIIHKWKTTKTKVESLIDANYKIRVYYEYTINAASYKDCVLSKRYKEYYIYGSEKALVITSLVFKGGVQ